eukprot:364804-Chlamydomonas_euryale.AAC.15
MGSHGGWQKHMRAPADFAYKIPDGLDSVTTASARCLKATTQSRGSREGGDLFVLLSEAQRRGAARPNANLLLMGWVCLMGGRGHTVRQRPQEVQCILNAKRPPPPGFLCLAITLLPSPQMHNIRHASDVQRPPATHAPTPRPIPGRCAAPTHPRTVPSLDLVQRPPPHPPPSHPIPGRCAELRRCCAPE